MNCNFDMSGKVYDNSTQDCIPCPLEGCSQCYNAAMCFACDEAQGYYMNNQTNDTCVHCPSTIANCNACSAENTCSACASGYSLENNECKEDPEDPEEPEEPPTEE